MSEDLNPIDPLGVFKVPVVDGFIKELLRPEDYFNLY